ncbi:MAG: hypothetical protein OIF38_08030 [Cellvibrionaceae bacterium]|nr:hypothetical protein [Cellvibrionaceae bacterium]
MALRFISALCLALLLNACASAPAPAPKMPPPKAKPRPQLIDPKVAEIKTRLQAAEKALAANRLTIPSADNANDHYRAVLALDPNNQQAKSGLQMIPLRYVELARSYAGKSNVAKARTLLRRALKLDPNNVPVKTLLAELKPLPAVARAEANKSISRDDNNYIIDPAALVQKSEQLAPYLQLIAQRARLEDLMAIIIAPTDADGRWIYQQMRQALPGYRLRGDIRRGRKPLVRLEVP